MIKKKREETNWKKMKSALETIFMDTVEDKSRGRTMVEKKKKKKTFTINKR